MKPNFTQLSDHPGKLIIFEGTDGSGKSTQAERLKKKIQKDGGKAVIVSWKDAPHFREYFQNLGNGEGMSMIGSEAHLFLQVADMLYQIERKVVPSLLKGYTVIMDRALPTITIRGLTLGFTLDQIENGLLWFAKSIYRDLFRSARTVFLSVSAKKSLENIKKRAKKGADMGEGTLLSLHMMQNFQYLPSGERLTKKVKNRILEKLQETYVSSYQQYFTHHQAIKIDANKGKKEVEEAINLALFPVMQTPSSSKKVGKKKSNR